ncbi:MAG: hypothetical protein HOP16_17485 [Acidobacteria bacterium]|nr:hypothetical protein [Acidobacteriota bacterium]
MMRAITGTLLSLPVFAICLGAVDVAEAQTPAAVEVHNHEGAHVSAADPTSPNLADYLTVNVALSDTGLQPSAVFVPAGRPVQLMLRNRGSVEHHYRVVGLVPDELLWVSRPEPALDAGVGDEHSAHHGLQLLRSRASSPAGIRPSGKEVHAYVAVPGDVDVVLFTASQMGTFDVECDLHRDRVGSLTVFAPAGEAQSAADSPRRRQALTRALSRDLGTVNYPGVEGVQIEATYATPEYVMQSLGGATAVAALQPDRHIAFLLTERTHIASLPEVAAPPQLMVNGRRVPLVDSKVMTGSVHHRATVYRFVRDDAFGSGHQMVTLHLPSGPEATWHLPLPVSSAGAGMDGPIGAGEQWGLILALLGGMVAAMWPCLFQLTVYFIPALAGVAMQEPGAPASSSRRRVLVAAFYFILGFTLVYTATGALIGFAAQRLGNTAQFEIWQRYFSVAAGVVVIGLALRVAAKVKAPLVCRMPILSNMGNAQKPATRLEMMLAGLAFATGCMTCFGSALVVGMVVYVGLAQSAFYGALVLFLFSLGMGIPLVLAALAMARALPLLMKLDRAVPWMGLASAVLMAGFGVLLISGNYMLVAEWSQRLATGAVSVPDVSGRVVLIVAIAGALGLAASLMRLTASNRARRSQSVSP